MVAVASKVSMSGSSHSRRHLQRFIMPHLKSAEIRHVLTRDRTILPATHTFIHIGTSHPAFTPQPQCITAHGLGLISRPADMGRRLSWPGCLAEILRWFARPKTVTHQSISRGGRESNSPISSRESNAVTTGLPNHSKVYSVQDDECQCQLT